MSRNTFSEKPLNSRVLATCWLLAGVTVLTIKIVSWAQCSQPNTNKTVACLNPLPQGAVTTCSGMADPPCSTSAIYKVLQFPDGTMDSPTGGTMTAQANCYQKTPCMYAPKTAICYSGNTQPTQLTYFQGNKTVVDMSNTCGQKKGG